MGCLQSFFTSHDNGHGNNLSSQEMSRRNSKQDEVDYKARLERKNCLAKETPEPEYDLSECNLKEIPSGVFIMCKVLRKESLLLQRNRLHALNGYIGDLQLLVTLNLSENRIRKLPDEIFRLENLRELLVNENHLEKLPPTINQLRKLELLDVSSNRLGSVEQINCMPALRILNLASNPRLKVLPDVLSTCSGLSDLVLDTENFDYPSPEVCRGGTANILQFLSTGEASMIVEKAEEALEVTKPPSRADDKKERILFEAAKKKEHKERDFLEAERLAQEKDYYLELQFQEQQKQRQQMLLKQLRREQSDTEARFNQLQQMKESERNKLVSDILKDEQESELVLSELLSLRNGPDPYLLEKEQLEQEKILEKVRLRENELRRQEILDCMKELLQQEMQIVQTSEYVEQRDAASRAILEEEQNSNLFLSDVFEKYNQNRLNVLEKVNQDEELQKSAVATLIAKNDARSWGLLEQIRILEREIGKLTDLELEKRKLNLDTQVNDLAARRIDLTYVLLDLMDQQEHRKAELLSTLRVLEEQNQNNPDFWLIKYQTLIDQQPSDLVLQTASIDPILGYHFLINGVVHCLPFLSKIWLTWQTDLAEISDDLLLEAGLKRAEDREGILRAIELYLNQQEQKEPIQTPSAPVVEEATEAIPGMAPKGEEEERSQTAKFSECVVCLDLEVQVIFLPCGHLCCCIDCQMELVECPMCRGEIERRIKVIQA